MLDYVRVAEHMEKNDEDESQFETLVFANNLQLWNKLFGEGAGETMEAQLEFEVPNSEAHLKRMIADFKKGEGLSSGPPAPAYKKPS